MKPIEVWCTQPEPTEILFRVHRAVHDPTVIPEDIEFSLDTPEAEWEYLPPSGAELIWLILQVLPEKQGGVRVYRDPVYQDDVLGVRIREVDSWTFTFPFVIHVLKNWVGWKPLASTETLYTRVEVAEDCHEDIVHWLEEQVTAVLP